MGNLLDSQASTIESHKLSKEETQHDRLWNPQPTDFNKRKRKRHKAISSIRCWVHLIVQMKMHFGRAPEMNMQNKIEL